MTSLNVLCSAPENVVPERPLGVPAGMASLNVPEGQMTSEEAVKLEILLMQEIQARKALSSLVEELQKELADLKGTPAQPIYSSMEPQAGDESEIRKAFNDEQQESDPRDLVAVTADRLDAGGMYQAEPSVWDACVLIGHGCLGTGVSLFMVLLWLANVAAQVFFCYIVLSGMIESDISTETLDQLLRYRTGIAHYVGYADTVAQRSMISELCDRDAALHQSTAQSNWYQSIESFKKAQAGKWLMVLAQLLWICTVFRELLAAWNLGHSLACVNRGHRTRVIVADSGSDSYLDGNFEIKSTFTGSLESLLTLMVVVRVVSISKLRLWTSILFVVIPRMAMAVLICITGVRYLGKTINPEDLVLNAIALEFITGIDELIFSVFAPQRMRTLMMNIEPFPLPQKISHGVAVMFSVLKVVVVIAIVVSVYFALLAPFFWRLDQASSILCEGNLDFVWARNPATSMIHAARSRASSVDMTLEGKYLLQVARPPLEAKHDWAPESDWLEYSTSDFTRVVIESQGGAEDITQAVFDTTYFEVVDALSVGSVPEAVSNLQCDDMSAGQTSAASLEYLRTIVGNSSITDCNDVSWQMCSQLNMTSLRAICPVRCGCDKPGRYSNKAHAGIFQSPTGGCPTPCNAMMATRNEVLESTSNIQEVQAGGTYACEDLDPTEFSFTATCVNTDQFVAARNAHNLDCRAPSITCSNEHDDSDFIAADMCCKCGGGSRSVSTSAACVFDLTDNCLNMDSPALWYLLYVRGLFEYMSTLTDFDDRVESAISNELNVTKMSKNDAAELVDWVANGSKKKSLVDGSWTLMPGYPHPRGLTGCAYLASFEIKSLLGIDLCNSDVYASIRFLCPVTCGCTSSVYNAESDGSSISYSVMTSHIPFSNARTALTSCPASCVLPHPDISGSSAYDDYDASGAKGQ